MNNFKFSKRSYNNLSGVHPILIHLAMLALPRSPLDFGITDGRRTIEEQKVLFADGKTTTMNSRHLTGHAIDIVVYVDGKVSWELSDYAKVFAVFNEVAEELGILVEWGGNWRTFKDGPHIQIRPDDWVWNG